MKKIIEPTYWKQNLNLDSGHIVLLNGPSSSGKTSIGKELQQITNLPYLFFSIDGFFDLFPDVERFDFGESILKMFKGFYGSVRAFANEGNNVIVDTVFQDGYHDFEYVRSIFDGINTDFTGLSCDLGILKEREIERGNRKSGLAEFQFERIHNGVNYSCEIDTSSLSIQHSAERLKENLKI